MISTNCIPINVSVLQKPGSEDSTILTILGRLGREQEICDSTWWGPSNSEDLKKMGSNMPENLEQILPN